MAKLSSWKSCTKRSTAPTPMPAAAPRSALIARRAISLSRSLRSKTRSSQRRARKATPRQGRVGVGEVMARIMAFQHLLCQITADFRGISRDFAQKKTPCRERQGVFAGNSLFFLPLRLGREDRLPGIAEMFGAEVEDRARLRRARHQML